MRNALGDLTNVKTVLSTILDPNQKSLSLKETDI